MQLQNPLPRQKRMRFAVGLIVLCSCAGPVISAPAPGTPTLVTNAPGAGKPDPLPLLRSLPLRFEQDLEGRWSARSAGYALGFEDSAVNLRLREGLVRLSFEGTNEVRNAASVKWEPSEKMLAPTNYFRGATFRSADAFARLRRPDLYPGIDVVYYGKGQQLEYDLNLAPGADPSLIRMRFEGADQLDVKQVSVNSSGDLVLKFASGEITQRLPTVYQKSPSGEVVAVRASYRVAEDGSIGVKLGDYDRAQALVIDPTIQLDFWLTGSNSQVAISLGHDSQGFEYMAGYTYSPNFSLGATGYQMNYQSDEDCWLMKFNPFATNPGSVIAYSTYFGGELDDDMRSMAVDAYGVMYFGGSTLSPDLPVTTNAYQSTLPNTNANLNGFVAAIDTNMAGSAGLIYSSFYGGSLNVVINGVATFEGEIYATGWTDTPDLPLANPYQASNAGEYDSFLAVFNPAITDSGTESLVYSSYLGGYTDDVGRSVDVDANGFAYIAGYTFSSNFPVSTNGFQQIYNDGGGDAFVTQIDPAAGVVLYSSFLGGTNVDVATKVQVEPSGNIAVAGYTFSTDFPLTANAAQLIYGGGGDAFVAVLNPTATSQAAAEVYGSYYGGSNTEVAYDMRYGPQGFYYIGGYTLSKDLPVSKNALSPASAGGGIDAFSAVLDPNTSVVYGSYITSDGNQVAYAVDTDASGNLYTAGYATGPIFPDNKPPHSNAGEFDVFFLLLSLP
jgi:hypothetical protein